MEKGDLNMRHLGVDRKVGGGARLSMNQQMGLHS